MPHLPGSDAPSPFPIELDLEADQRAPRRLRATPFEAPPSLPRIHPVLGDSDVGTDQIDRTVGLIFLLSAALEVPSLLLGRGSLVAVLFSALVGIAFLRRVDWVRQWVLIGCCIQLVITLLMALLLPRALGFVIAALLHTGGLLALVAGRALSRRAYGMSLAAIVGGSVLGFMVALALR